MPVQARLDIRCVRGDTVAHVPVSRTSLKRATKTRVVNMVLALCSGLSRLTAIPLVRRACEVPFKQMLVLPLMIDGGCFGFTYEGFLSLRRL